MGRVTVKEKRPHPIVPHYQFGLWLRANIRHKAGWEKSDYNNHSSSSYEKIKHTSKGKNEVAPLKGAKMEVASGNGGKLENMIDKTSPNQETFLSKDVVEQNMKISGISLIQSVAYNEEA